MRSKGILILIAKTVYFFFVFSVVNQPFWEYGGKEFRSPRYEVSYVYADSFDDMLKGGKDLGKGIVPDFTPQNIDQTLGNKGLGDHNSIIPYSAESSQEIVKIFKEEESSYLDV